jgi:hypothetical protein
VTCCAPGSRRLGGSVVGAGRVAVASVRSRAVVQVRFKIMRNIGLAFVRLGQYPDALQSFATVMDNVPDHQVRL